MVTVHKRGMKLTARTQSNDWADDEFGQADCGDDRLTQRLAVLARKISQTPHCSSPQALDAATLKAAYRVPVLRQPEGRRQGHAGAAYRTNARSHPATVGGLGAAGHERVQSIFSIRKSQGEKTGENCAGKSKQRFLLHPTSKFHLFFRTRIAIA